MSMTLTIAAGAGVLLLAAWLVYRRQGGTAVADGGAARPANAATLDDSTWREAGAGDRFKAVLRGGRHGLALRREGPQTIYLRRDGDGVCVVQRPEAVYGGRPNWEHIAALTLLMGKAERCWPGTAISGRLEYTDQAVPVAYSPRLLADLEEETAPAHSGAAATPG
jgi:hypothetical protein